MGNSINQSNSIYRKTDVEFLPDEIMVEIMDKFKSNDVLTSIKNILAFGKTNKRHLKLSKTVRFGVELCYGYEFVPISFIRDIYDDSKQFVNITFEQGIIIHWSNKKCNSDIMAHSSATLMVRRNRNSDGFKIKCNQGGCSQCKKIKVTEKELAMVVMCCVLCGMDHEIHSNSQEEVDDRMLAYLSRCLPQIHY